MADIYIYIGLDRGFYRDTQGVCRDNVDRDYVRVVVEWKRNSSYYFGFRVGHCPQYCGIKWTRKWTMEASLGFRVARRSKKNQMAHHARLSSPRRAMSQGPKQCRVQGLRCWVQGLGRRV